MIATDAHSLAYGISGRLRAKYGELKEDTPLFDVIYNICEEMVEFVHEINRNRERIESLEYTISSMKGEKGVISYVDGGSVSPSPKYNEAVLFGENDKIVMLKGVDHTRLEFYPQDGSFNSYNSDEVAALLWQKMQKKNEIENTEFIEALKSL